MKKHHFNKLIYFFLFFVTQISAQNGTFYSSDKEISNSLINSIYQDSRNYIWIATEDGLNRFDGVDFKVYKHIKSDPKSIKVNYVRCLFEDSSNRFWIGCANGLLLYNRLNDSFKEVDIFNNGVKIQPYISSIIEAKNGEIWISTSGQGIIRIKKGLNSCKIDTKLSNRLSSLFLTFIFQDSNQNIWIGTDNHGLNRYTPKTDKLEILKIPENIKSNLVSSICEDNIKNIFVGTLSNGLFIFDKQTFKFIPVLYKNKHINFSITSLLFDKQMRLLVGTDGNGIKIFNYNTNKLEDFRIPFATFDFSEMKVHALFQDKAGNLWTGLFQKGVFLSPNYKNKFNYLGNKFYNTNIIGSSCVMSILKDKQNVLWLGTDNDGIYSIDNNGKSRHFDHRNDVSSISRSAMSMVDDDKGFIWVGSYLDGLTRLDKRTGKCTYYNNKSVYSENETSNNKITCLVKDNNNKIWIGTNGSGIFAFNMNTQKFTEHYSSESQDNFKLQNNWINCGFCDSKGIMWFGSYFGLCSINPRTNRIENFSTQNQNLPGNIVYAINEDEKRNIWIGTTSGLACYDIKTHKSKIFTMGNGLPSNVICSILIDEDGNLWLSTHMGLSKYIVKNNRFINFFSFDGLQGNEFNKGASFRTSNGEIFFGGINGVTYFYPQEVVYSQTPLHAVLTGLNIFNKPVVTNQKEGNHVIIDKFISDVNTVHLNYKDNLFTLIFSTFDFGSPERVYYRYKIDKLNAEWVTTPKGVNKISFSNIGYGTFKLKVRACVQNEISDEKVIMLIISPPWYLSWWAKLIYFILSIISIWFTVRYYLNRNKRKLELMRRDHAEQINEAKLQFFINIAHEIRTPMTLIISPLEKLISQNADKDKKKMYEMMNRNAQRILRLINELMDVRKIDKGLMVVRFRETEIVGFIEDIMQTFEYQAVKRNINFNFYHEILSLDVWIDQNNFDKILFNLLSNAFKFTPDNGDISINLRTGMDENAIERLKNFFEITVSDSGIGIEEAEIEKIFERFYQIEKDQIKSNFGTGIGLHLARSLVELQHGIIFAKKRMEVNGIEFTVRLPLGNSHLTEAEISSKQTDYELEYKEKLKIQKIPELETNIDIKKKSKSNYRILIVEDEDEIRNYISSELSDLYKVSTCSDGKEALDFILNEKPHLVISDIMMPKMDGVTLCKKIKSNININHIPIILLTAKFADENISEGLEIGADAYVTKPFNIELLKKQIINLIENRERLKENILDKENVMSMIKKVEVNSPDDILLEKILKIINENIGTQDLNVEMLASGVGMSRVHMHRKLKELTNQSAREFIKNIRLKQAGELLSQQKQSISDIAYALGFSNLPHFSNAFREFYGMSPTEYTKKNDLNNNA